MEKYFIGIDSGTSGIKAVLFDLKGNEIGQKSFPLKGIFPREDMYEEDMLEIWDKAVKCVKAVTEAFPDKEIVGIGITAQGDGLWMVDENMEPVRNGCCFCDGRAAKIVDRWVEDGTCDKLFEITGTRIFTGNQNGIVKWMEEHEPENLDKSRWLLHLKDYLFYRFTGKVTTDATDQSLIFLDQNKRDYLDETFKICGIEKYKDKYPPVLSAKENAFPVQKELAKELGLGENVIVTSGPMDVSACALGSGVVENGHCCSIIGTAALHEMVIGKPLQDNIKAGMTVCHVMENRWLRLMASEDYQIDVECEEFILVHMDVRLIIQVLVNLIDNAIKYTLPGSKICIRGIKKDGKAQISVADNGPGISDEVKPHIFEMFYTGNNTIADSHRSLGLGLSLCRSIIEAHGGTLVLTDNIPRGCMFTFTLPLSEVILNE